MLSISPLLFVVLMLASLLVGVGACLLVVLPMAHSMRKTNSEYRNQLGTLGLAWSGVLEYYEHENDRWRSIAAETDRRFWLAAKLGYGEKKGSTGALADKMLGEPPSPLPTSAGRSRHRGALTGPEEVRIARQARMNTLSKILSTPEPTDGQDAKSP